jgi:spore cortex biosynthesis protein YabQ
VGSLPLQVYAFLVVVLTGIACSFLFDLYRSWRSLAHPRRLAGDVADLAFGVLATVVVAAGLFLSNWGDLRLYVFLGLVLGAAAYHWLASPVVQPAARRALWAVARLVRRAWRAAAWPFRAAARAARWARRGGASAARSGAGLARGCAAWFRRRFRSPAG